MGKTRRILFIALAGIFLAWFAWFLLAPREPVYRGKTLSAWLEEARQSDLVDYDWANPEAVSAIRHIGTNALPELLRLVAAKDSRLKKALLELQNKQSRISLPIRSEDEYHELASYGFFVLGSAASPAVPDLIALFKNEDSEIRSSAASALGFIGPSARDAVPALISALNTNHEEIASITFALGKIGPESASGIPALVRLANTNLDQFTRPFVETALILIRGDSLQPYINQLKDTSNLSNWNNAVMVIGTCTSNAESAVPVLIETLTQTNKSIRLYVLLALGQIKRRPDLCLPVIVPFLRSPDTGLRMMAFYPLHRFGRDAKAAVPEIIRCLNDPEVTVREIATNALRDIDPEAAAKAGIK